MSSRSTATAQILSLNSRFILLIALMIRGARGRSDHYWLDQRVDSRRALYSRKLSIFESLLGRSIVFGHRRDASWRTTAKKVADIATAG